MAKLEVLEDDEPVAAKPAKVTEATVIDAAGRKIGIKKLRPTDKMKLILLVGAEGAANEAYFGYAVLAGCVTSIDGDPVFPPTKQAELEFIVDRLDDAGLDAVGEGYVANFGAKPQTEDTKAAVKN